MRPGSANSLGRPAGILPVACAVILAAVFLWSCASTSPLAKAAREEIERQKKEAGTAAQAAKAKDAKAKDAKAAEAGAEAAGKQGEPGPQAMVIDKRPQKYGIYIYRDGKFIPLPTLGATYSGVWFPISLTSKKLAACYVSEADVKDLPVFRKDDLLCIHYKNAGKMSWYYYPLTRFAQNDFPGAIDSEIWERPAGYYLGFSAIGPSQALKGIFGKPYEDGYRCDQQRVGLDDIVFQDSSVLFVKLNPAANLAISRYIITNKAISFGEVKDYRDLLSQVTDEGAGFDMAEVSAMANFEGLRDAIERYNEETSVRYMLREKDFVLKKNQIIDTGIMVNEPCYVSFASDGDFNLILSPGDWDDQSGWMPADQPFGKEGKELPLIKGTFAYPVKPRYFALRYERAGQGNQVRLQGVSDGTRIKVIYCPMFCYEDSYQSHVSKGFEDHNQGLYARAVGEYEAALAELPEYPYALNNMAWLYETATDPAFRQPKKALELAVKAARFRPVKPYILDTLALAWYQNGNIDKAIECQQAAAIAVADSESYSSVYMERFNQYKEVKDILLKAQKLEYDKKFKEAVEELDRALAIMPRSVDALSHKSWILATSKDATLFDPKAALELAQKAYEIAPDSAFVCDTLAEALSINGSREKALESARRAWYLAPVDDYYKARVEHFSEKKK